jgi:arylsulfatase A-like enzyme
MPATYLERYGTVQKVTHAELTDKEKKQWQPWQEPVRFTPGDFPRRENVEKDYMGGISYATYHAMMEWLDDCFGRIMKSLEDNGLADNTIVVFTSDHGEMLGSHGLRGKMIYFDESVRIPFMVKWPGHIKPGTVSDACIGTVDFLPTVLGLMGISCPKDVQGTNLAHCALGTPGPEPEGAFLAGYSGYGQFSDGWEYRGIRTKRYTYARSLMQLRRWYGGWKEGDDFSKEPEIFLTDNEKDPYQRNNLAGKPEYREIQEHLESLVQAHMDRTGDKFLKGTEYKQFYDEENRRIKPLT